MLDWLLAALTAVLQVPDILTTNALLSRGGRELNPGVRLLMRLFRRRWWWAKLAIALPATAFLAASPDPLATWALGLVALLHVAAVWSNLRQLRRTSRP
ncbi:DUF5658 family protein [Desulfohalovibrio reitneri]|uniref:DUF5658 family protein n=1 Tax=Desulfohalovibrio reitneri TaxID=1307759 RepID=UPI0004A73919|nr:DUF5658 family protein [Desulfohalovibrio reitneri]